MRSVVAKALASGCLLLGAAACERSAPQIVLSGPTMGTVYTVKAVRPPANVDAATLRATIDDVLARIDASMSGYRADSEIARFNTHASTEWFEVSAELAAVMQIALEVSQASAGAFDVTLAPLVAAWGFGAGGEPRSLPDPQRLRQLAQSVGYRKLHVRMAPPALRKDDAELTVDLNGIAPGFAVDLLTQRLQFLGIAHFLIDIGGEIRARGRNVSGQPWRIAVEQPLDARPSPHALVYLDDAAVATSGEYRHYYVRDGKRYSHTIDPRTARPIEHELGSAVVIAPTAAYSDAWATALNVLGAQEGYELAARLHLSAMFIERRGERWVRRMTASFEKQATPVFLLDTQPSRAHR